MDDLKAGGRGLGEGGVPGRCSVFDNASDVGEIGGPEVRLGRAKVAIGGLLELVEAPARGLKDVGEVWLECKATVEMNAKEANSVLDWGGEAVDEDGRRRVGRVVGK